jgi:uncharacterized protein
MKLISFQDTEGFLAKTQAWLEEREAENNLMLGIALRLHKYPERIKAQPFLGCVEEGGSILSAAVMTPPHNLVLVGKPEGEALQSLVDGLMAHNWSLPGVVGPVETSRAFASFWKKAAEKNFHTGLRTRLYRLDRVIPPVAVHGYLRVAQPEDISLIARWIEAFQEEALHESVEQEEVLRQAERFINDGNLFIWDDRDPVCMAASVRSTRHGVSVNAVYTPPQQRRKGYASACVAALSQRLLDSGYRFCCLFTDLANPTSNHVYMDIGYRPVCDFEELRFEEASSEQEPGNAEG